PEELRRALRRKAQAAGATAREREHHLEGPLPRAIGKPRHLSAAGARETAHLGGCGRDARIRRPSRVDGASDGAGDHRRYGRAVWDEGGAGGEGGDWAEE